MEPCEVIKYRGFNINIFPDNDPLSPRTEWDNLGTMICWHNNYNIGDKHTFPDPAALICDILDKCNMNTKKVDEDYVLDLNSQDFINKYLDKVNKKCIMLPIYLYDHSGITINTCGFSCQWDSGQIGWIYITYEKIRKEYGWKVITKERKEKIKSYLISEVETYDNFLTGAVYGYQIEPTSRNKNIECDDSCWGFFGYDHEKSGLLEYAKPEIDYAIKKYKEEVKENKKELISMNKLIKTCWAY